MAYDHLNGIPILGQKSLLSDVPAYTEAIDTLLRQLMPLGTIAPYYKDTAPNGMWLICNGDPAVGDKYENYRREIGPNTPDLRGRTLIGQGGGYNFDAPDGEATVTLDATEIPAHSHSITDPGHYHSVGGASTGGVGATSLLRSANSADGIYPVGTGTSKTGITGTNNNAGGGGSHNNMQPYLPINYIILASYEA